MVLGRIRWKGGVVHDGTDGDISEGLIGRDGRPGQVQAGRTCEGAESVRDQRVEA